jgi:cobalamin biosynthesis protein CobW
MTASLARVPCTIVTGFLGAGKTTLIRHVLANAQGRRLAVIVNEFGDVGIDGDLLKGCGDAACPEENIVELANGCLCCTVADEFVPALDGLLARRPAVEHIVIETSGLALPKPLVQAFNWPAIKSRVTVDGVVAVIDGAALADGRVAADLDALARQRAAAPTPPSPASGGGTGRGHDDPVEEVFSDQVACADLVVLNKRDLLDAESLGKARAAVTGALGRAVKIVAVAEGKVDPALLLGLGLATEDAIENRPTRHDSEPEHDHDDFTSFVVTLPEIADPAALAGRVAALAETHDVLRVKGFAAVAGKPMRLLVQGVGTRVTHQYDRPWNASEQRNGRLVVIGLKGLDRAGVARALLG